MVPSVPPARPVQLFDKVELYSTHHCVTGSLKHVYEAHGFPISEDLLLGLGRGLGFAYVHTPGADPFYGGRANLERPGRAGLERTAGRRTGVSVQSHETTSPQEAQQSLRELLLNGEPVFVYLDLGLLPYVDVPEGYHFGGHAVVVAGHDPVTDDVLVVDGDPTPHPVSWEVLERARGSTFEPFPPRHRWHTFDFSSARPPTVQEVRTAIAEVCQQMLEPPSATLGVEGIRTARARTRHWPDVLDADELRRACGNVAVFIDHRGGTGGGIFRYMYARFLDEAAQLTAEPRLTGLSTELSAIGDRWEEVAAGLTRAAGAPDPAALLATATAPMAEIADREEACWRSLARLVAD